MNTYFIFYDSFASFVREFGFSIYHMDDISTELKLQIETLVTGTKETEFVTQNGERFARNWYALRDNRYRETEIRENFEKELYMINTVFQKWYGLHIGFTGSKLIISYYYDIISSSLSELCREYTSERIREITVSHVRNFNNSTPGIEKYLRNRTHDLYFVK